MDKQARDTQIDEILNLPEGEQDRALESLRREYPDVAAEAEKIRSTAREDWGSLLPEQIPLEDSPAPAPSLGTRLGNYELVEMIAKGGMGEVYKARHLETGRLVALKRPNPTFLEDPWRFLLELKTMQKLKHPNIIEIIDIDEANLFYTMELLEGGSLQVIAMLLRDDPRRAASLMVKVANAVDYVHKIGKVIHRDLKPTNVLLDAGGEPKVTDFGLARSMSPGESLTISGVLGSVPYMSPEQARGGEKREHHDSRTDVWGLGATLYDLLAGQPPFSGDNALQQLKQNERPLPLSFLNATVPDELELVCLRCLEPDKTGRYGSAHEVAEDLERWLRGEPTAAASTMSPVRATRLAVRRLAGRPLSKEEWLLLEWILAAALNNGVFRNDELLREAKTLEDLHAHCGSPWSNPRDQLLRAGLLGEVEDMPGECYLADLDALVPRLAGLIGLDPQRLQAEGARLRTLLKTVAKHKATQRTWDLRQARVPMLSGSQTTISPGRIEQATFEALRSIKPGQALRIMSKYGTWLRREPVRQEVDALRQRGGRLEVIVASPPPYQAEGYTEWAESVIVLHGWGAELAILDHAIHKESMNLGDGIALHTLREENSYRLRWEVTRKPEDLDRLGRSFKGYWRRADPLAEWLKKNQLRFHGGDFEVFAFGPFALDEVVAAWDGAGRLPHPDVDAGIEPTWQAALGRASAEGRPAPTDGALCRLDPTAARVVQRGAGQVLSLAFGPASYREHIGTNLRPDVAREAAAGRLDEAHLASPAAACVALVTRDGKILVARRSGSTHEHPGCWHVPGGHIERDKHVKDGRVDVFAAILDEITEEVACAAGKIRPGTLKCNGLVRDRRTLKPELVFSACLDVDSAELGVGNDEHVGLTFVPNDRESLAARLLDSPAGWVPVGRACLSLYGRVAFGDEWFIDIIDRLRDCLWERSL